MASKLPGIAFIGLGLIVSIASYFIDYTKMIIFFYLGLVFIAVGVFRTGVNYMTKEKGAPKSIRQIVSEDRVKKMQAILCPVCKSKQHPLFNFCPKCGARIK